MRNTYVNRASVWTVPREPSFFGTFIADPSPMPDDDGPEEPAESWHEKYALQIAPFLERIPPVEADIIELYFGPAKKPGRDIGIILGLSQVGVGYRLRRALSRLRWLWSVPHFTAGDLRRELALRVSKR